MGKQVTEMLKGTLEGIVLAILAGRSAYGYEITAWLREKGFSDIAEGTVYALLIRIEQRGLVDVEKVPSEKGPPRKVYSLNAQGQAHLDEFWRTWSFLSERLEQLREREKLDMAAKWIETLTGSLEQKKQYRQHKARVEALPEPYRAAAKAFERYFMYYGGITDGDTLVTMFGDFADLWERAAVDGTPVGDDRRRRPGRVRRGLRAGLRRASSGSTRSALAWSRRSTTRRAGRAANDHRCRHPRGGPGEVVRRPARAARRGPRGGAGQHLRPARLQRRGQDHGREDPVHAAQVRCGDGHRRRLRRRHAAGRGAGVHQPDGAVRRRGRDPHRAGEPGAGRPVAAPAGRRPDRGRAAGPLPAHRGGGPHRWRRTPEACGAAWTSP